MVEVLGRYSKLEPLQTLPEVEAYRSVSSELQPRIHKLDQRLDPAVIAELVAAYEGGTPTTQLTQQYGIGKGSVLKVLREAGVQMRNQGLDSSDLPDAIRRYEAGESLATIGVRFGCDRTVIRRALAKAGVSIRPRPGFSRR